jgi:hypothetical protein
MRDLVNLVVALPAIDLAVRRAEMPLLIDM